MNKYIVGVDEVGRGSLVGSVIICAFKSQNSLFEEFPFKVRDSKKISKIIYGLIAPDSGEMKLSGQLFQPKNPRDARKNGIGMVFQHFSLFNALSVFENIAIGLDERFEAASLKSRIINLSKN